jgi:hypothetical protein
VLRDRLLVKPPHFLNTFRSSYVSSTVAQEKKSVCQKIQPWFERTEELRKRFQLKEKILCARFNIEFICYYPFFSARQKENVDLNEILLPILDTICSRIGYSGERKKPQNVKIVPFGTSLDKMSNRRTYVCE